MDPCLYEILIRRSSGTAIILDNKWMNESMNILGQLVIYVGKIINLDAYTTSSTKEIPGILKTYIWKTKLEIFRRKYRIFITFS